MSKPSKTISVDIGIDAHKNVAEIVKRTGETKVQLFERMILTEYKRIMNNESISEIPDNQLNEIIKRLNESIELQKKGTESNTVIREGMNKIYCSTLVSIKELFRTMHFLSGCFSNSSLLREEQLSIISKNADNNAIDSLSAVFKMLTELQPKDILDTLKRK